MSAINIKLSDDFTVAGKGFSLPPERRARLEHSINKYFFKSSDVAAFLGGAEDFGFRFKGESIVLSAGGKRGVFAMPAQVRRQVRLVQGYARGMGIVGGKAPEVRGEEVKGVVDPMRAPMGTKERVLAVGGAAVSGSSLVRNSMSAMNPAQVASKKMSALGFVGGGAWFLWGIMAWRDGRKERDGAEKIGDVEGVRRAKGKMAEGATLGVGGACFLIEKGTEYGKDHVAEVAMKVADFGTSFFLGVSCLVGVGLSALGVARCRSFSRALDDYDLETDRGALGAVQFLRDSLSASEGESVEMKVRMLKRRTSAKAVDLILKNSDRILERGNVEEARALIAAVKGENRTKMILYAIGFLAALLSLVGVVIGTFFSFGALPAILYAISNGISLGVACGAGISAVWRGGGDEVFAPGLNGGR